MGIWPQEPYECKSGAIPQSWLDEYWFL